MAKDLAHITISNPLREIGVTALETSRLKCEKTEGFNMLNAHETIDIRLCLSSTIKKVRNTRLHDVI